MFDVEVIPRILSTKLNCVSVVDETLSLTLTLIVDVSIPSLGNTYL